MYGGGGGGSQQRASDIEQPTTDNRQPPTTKTQQPTPDTEHGAYLVKQVIAEEFEHVTVTGLRPVWVHLVLRPLVNAPELDHKFEQPAVLGFVRQVGLERICDTVHHVELVERLGERSRGLWVMGCEVVGLVRSGIERGIGVRAFRQRGNQSSTHLRRNGGAKLENIGRFGDEAEQNVVKVL